MDTKDFTALFTYTNVSECENTLQFAYAIRETLQQAEFQTDKRVKAAIVLKKLEKEILTAEQYWLDNGGASKMPF